MTEESNNPSPPEDQQEAPAPWDEIIPLERFRGACGMNYYLADYVSGVANGFITHLDKKQANIHLDELQLDPGDELHIQCFIFIDEHKSGRPDDLDTDDLLQRAQTALRLFFEQAVFEDDDFRDYCHIGFSSGMAGNRVDPNEQERHFFDAAAAIQRRYGDDHIVSRGLRARYEELKQNPRSFFIFAESLFRGVMLDLTERINALTPPSQIRAGAAEDGALDS